MKFNLPETERQPDTNEPQIGYVYRALPHKDAEALAKLTEDAKELSKRIEAMGMTWEDLK